MTNYINTFLSKLTYFFLFLLIIFGCSSNITKEEENAEQTVINKIIEQTSSDFYNSYFTPVRKKYFTGDGKVHIFLLESISVIEYSDTLEFIVENGSVVNFAKVKGIPDCFEDENNCIFKINKDKLLRYLKDKQVIEPGNEFIAKSIWDDEGKRFLWKVTITKEKFNVGDRVRGKGIFVFVNPANGKIVKTKEWRIN